MEALNKLFGDSKKVLIKGGTFNNVQGNYHYNDYTQRTTNIDSYNIIGNIIENANNSRTQMIYHEGNACPTPHGRSANGRVPTADASASGMNNNHARIESPESLSPPSRQPQARLDENNSPPFSYGFPTMNSPIQHPGQSIYVQPGEVRSMRASEVAFIRHQIAQAIQELDAEFPAEYDAEEVSSEEISNGMRSQSLSAGLTLDEPDAASSSHADGTSDQAARYPGLRDLAQHIANTATMSTTFLHGMIAPITGASGMSAVRPTPIRASSSGTIKVDKVDKGPKHVTIQGNYTEVDRTVHELNFNSHIVANNIVENSFGEREEEIVENKKRPKARSCSEETGV